MNHALPPAPAHVPKDRVCDLNMYDHILGDEDYHESWKRMQQEQAHDMVWTPHNGGHWIALRGSMIREIYGDYSRFTSEVMYIPKAVGEQYDMIPVRMDPPQHTPFRYVLNKNLNLREIRKLEDEVRRIAVSLIEPLKDRGACDFCNDYSKLFPIHVFLAMADLPASDTAMLRSLAAGMLQVPAGTPDEMVASFTRAKDAFWDYVRPVISERKGKEGTDLLSVIVNSEVEGRAMTERETLSLVALVLLAGLDTTVNFLGFVMAFLGKNPGHVQQLVDEPSRIPRCVEELFRRFPVVAEARMVRDDLVYEGLALKKGEMILLPTVLTGLDERENENAMEVDFSRQHPKHTTFGEGVHRCVGMHLARMEVTVTLQEWLKRVPRFQLAPGARPQFHAGLIAGISNVPLIWDVAR